MPEPRIDRAGTTRNVEDVRVKVSCIETVFETDLLMAWLPIVSVPLQRDGDESARGWNTVLGLFLGPDIEYEL